MSNRKNENKQDMVMEMMPVPEEQPQARSVKDVLMENVIMINGLSYTHQEARKFMPIFEKIANDLTACVVAIEKEEQKHQGGEKNAEADPE